MHITLVIHSLKGGGAERVTSHMAAYWSNKGYRVTVLTLASTENNRYTLPQGVELQALGIDGISTGFISGLWNNITRIKKLRSTISALNAEIVISMMAQANVMTGLACLKLPCKCIGSERNYPAIDYIGRLWGFLRKYSYCFLDTVVVQTKIGEQWIVNNTNAKRVITIPNPLLLPLPQLEPVLSPDKALNRKMILGVGRLTEQKQFDHLIESFSKIAQQHPDWDLAIVGEGEKREQLEKLIKENNLAGRARLIGRVGNISDWYQAADIFALTSFTEGFPNALMEAMANGVPCVSYNCLTGPKELIDSEKNGILIEADDRQELTRTLNRLIFSESLQKTLKKNGPNVIDKLHPDIIFGEWENEIRKLISSHPEGVK